MCGTFIEVGGVKTTLNGSSVDPNTCLHMCCLSISQIMQESTLAYFFAKIYRFHGEKVGLMLEAVDIILNTSLVTILDQYG